MPVKIKAVSSFKTIQDYQWLEDWCHRVQRANNSFYTRMNIATSLGNTVVWAHNAGKTGLETLVFFPGARTCSMFLDMDNALAEIKKTHRIFLVDVNGQASLSEGKSPSIKSNGYGIWAREVLQQLNIELV